MVAIYDNTYNGRLPSVRAQTPIPVLVQHQILMIIREEENVSKQKDPKTEDKKKLSQISYVIF